ncbi:LPXTG cell wall anchor domain-containing protein [Microbacterium sp. Sa4CUA7]|uniref:LPXTG cell wall anchor domain-containing protein n=1 Tax=Microbacterium pullorum TaxID=2762236 RepID=A0ABR8S5P2_9MICO|nr:LPXTG cell wall anchor domain-containing protein [Microbacterium pullorum]MBD7958796.1 LPXTG cell wall anchor domain-containing protein [Microbacterium pullorum]
MRFPSLSTAGDDTVTIDVDIAPLQAPAPVVPPADVLPDWLPVTGAEPAWLLAIAAAAMIVAGARLVARRRHSIPRRSGG